MLLHQERHIEMITKVGIELNEDMVKLTVVGRAYDGLPVAHFPRVKNEEDMSMLFYKQQAEFIVKEICRGALLPSKMSMNIDDQYCFNYLIEKGISYITLCESSYPRYLAFQYLQDLNKEIEKLDTNFLHTLTKPYSFIKFGNLFKDILVSSCMYKITTINSNNVIAKIRRRYLDTRTQANLSILNANLRQDLDVIIEDISKIIEDRKRSVYAFLLESFFWLQVLPFMLDKMLLLILTEFIEKALAPIPVIALKWTPITLMSVVAIVVLWSRFIVKDY
ncbi:hypothetical protein C5167_048481 [Papaver somniferum]|uniref:Longin domain-containing protein n=1 Tax=Papaver somniferum TaxID=3469 RepID=A0A4Y7KKU6_PAPSO|nr:hypothetical protein C5167_048481 [Papaver somniferum]